jgi:hypothetical protein
MNHDLLERLMVARQAGGAVEMLKAEIAAESASSLGHIGRQVEASLKELRAFDAAGTGTADERLALVKKSARAVWSYFVQRETCGMRDHRWVIADYGIPGEVLVRLGAVER